MNLTMRPGNPDDAAECGNICYAAFKAIADHHNFPPDFPNPDVAIGLLSYLLARDDIYSVVAEVDGRLVGSNFLWEGSVIAGIGPITVDPSVQNAALGRRMMEHALDRVQVHRFAGVRLVQAAYHNRSLSLYAKLGFDVREPLSLLQGPAIGLKLPGFAVRAAREEDLEACNKLYLKVHGHERTLELKQSINDGTAMVVERDGRITGYTTGIGFIGYAAGETNEDIKALIGAAPAFTGPGFLLPSRNGDLLRWCFANGLRIVFPMTLMSVGLYNEPNGAFLPSVIY